MKTSRSTAANRKRHQIRSSILQFCRLPRTKKEIFSKFKSNTVSGITVGAFLSFLSQDHTLLYDAKTGTYIKPKKKCNCSVCRQIKVYWGKK